MKRPLKITAAFVAAGTSLAAFATYAAAQAEKRTPALEKLIKDAEAEGVLNVGWGPTFNGASGAREMQDALNKKYGINIRINYTPSSSMPRIAIRTVQEISAGRKPSTDLNLGAETTIAILLRGKALMPVNWSEYWPEITKEMQTDNGTAVHVATLFAGIHYNAKLVKPDQVPRKVADVFRPEWKGKIASTPYAAGFDRLALSRGGDKVRPMVAKAAEWSGGLIRCGENERIASGEFILLFLDCGRTNNTLLTENGGPVGQVVLDDAALTTNWFFGVPKTSDHPNLAILLAGYLATEDGQMVLEKIAGTASHRTPGTQAYKIAKDLESRGVEILTQTPDQLLGMSKEMEAYRKEFQGALRR